MVKLAISEYYNVDLLDNLPQYITELIITHPTKKILQENQSTKS